MLQTTPLRSPNNNRNCKVLDRIAVDVAKLDASIALRIAQQKMQNAMVVEKSDTSNEYVMIQPLGEGYALQTRLW